MKSLFDHEAHTEILERIHKLNASSEPSWGKMTVGQMLWHCQYPLKSGIENPKTNTSGNLLAKLFFKKSMYSDKAWRKNLPTAPQLKAKEPKDFSAEKEKLVQLVSDFHQVKERQEWNPHPVFGTFTKEQWGKMEYKHLDHHLRQFEV